MNLWDSVAALGVLLIFGLLYQRRSKNGLPYPPGPKALPIVGNIRDMAVKTLWYPATRWAKEFGTFSRVVSLWGEVMLTRFDPRFRLLSPRLRTRNHHREYLPGSYGAAGQERLHLLRQAQHGDGS